MPSPERAEPDLRPFPEADSRQHASPARLLTIVIIVLEGREKLARCLSALTGPATSIGHEIIVPYDASHRDVVSLERQFPGVHFLPSPGRHTHAKLRALAVQQASGDIVAITEDHCIPAPDWPDQVLVEHEIPHAAIGGTVEKTVPDTLLNWSLYLADYVRYANPALAGMVDQITDCNATYKRVALRQIADVWYKEFHEPEVNAALRGIGETLWFAPAVVVHQQRDLSLSEAVRDRFAFGRLFGARRAVGGTARRRLFYAALSPFLPLLLTARIGGQVVRKRRYMGPFLRALPIVICLNAVWAWGEFVGNLTGGATGSPKPIMH